MGTTWTKLKHWRSKSDATWKITPIREHFPKTNYAGTRFPDVDWEGNFTDEDLDEIHAQLPYHARRRGLKRAGTRHKRTQSEDFYRFKPQQEDFGCKTDEVSHISVSPSKSSLDFDQEGKYYDFDIDEEHIELDNNIVEFKWLPDDQEISFRSQKTLPPIQRPRNLLALINTNRNNIEINPFRFTQNTAAKIAKSYPFGLLLQQQISNLAAKQDNEKQVIIDKFDQVGDGSESPNISEFSTQPNTQPNSLPNSRKVTERRVNFAASTRNLNIPQTETPRLNRNPLAKRNTVEFWHADTDVLNNSLKLGPESDKDKNSKINHYVIAKKIRRWKIGKVHLWTNEKTWQRFEVSIAKKKKLEKKWVSKGKTALSWLQNEIKILSQLNHPFTQSLEEYHETQDKYYLFQKQEQFEALARRCPMTALMAQDIFKQIVLVMEYLHEIIGIVHRDIKPESFTIDKNCQIKIWDFHYSHFISDTTAVVPDHNNYSFMAPEMWQNDSSQITNVKALDIWALGITLYFWLSGKIPFLHNEDEDISSQVILEEIYRLDYLSDEWESFLKRLLTKDPEKRATIKQLKSHPWIKSGNL